jgi:hypothetical protein
MNEIENAGQNIQAGLFWLFTTLIGGAIALGCGYFVYLNWRELIPTLAILTFWVVVALVKWDGK